MTFVQRTGIDIIDLYDRHVDTVWRVCYSYMKNTADTEDMVQETFIRLIKSGNDFESREHEKAWLIVTASNLCKNELKRPGRAADNIDDHPEINDQAAPGRGEVLDAVLALPEKYRIAVYLFYYEGYKTGEIAKMLHIPEATVKTRLRRARGTLKTMIGGVSDE